MGENVGVTPERSVVVAIDGEKAILLTKTGAFVAVDRQDLSVGDETVYLPSASARRARVPLWRWGSAVAAALLVAAVAISRLTPGAYAKTAAYVSVEIDPGFTLGVASTGHVTVVRPEDQDARALGRSLSLVGLPVSTAVEDIVKAALRAKLVSPKKWTAFVVATYSASSTPVPTSLEKDIQRAAALGKATLAAHAVPNDAEAVVVTPVLVRRAQARNMTVGEYVVWLEFTKNGKTLSTQAFKKGLSQAIGASGGKAFFHQLTQVIQKGSASSLTLQTQGNGTVTLTLPSGIEGLSSGDEGGNGADHSQNKSGSQDKNKGTGDKSGNGDQGGTSAPSGDSGASKSTSKDSVKSSSKDGQGSVTPTCTLTDGQDGSGVSLDCSPSSSQGDEKGSSVSVPSTDN